MSSDIKAIESAVSTIARMQSSRVKVILLYGIAFTALRSVIPALERLTLGRQYDITMSSCDVDVNPSL